MIDSESKVIMTKWDQVSKILTTQFKGLVSVEDADEWSKGLWHELGNLPQQSTFKLLLDLRGFEPISIEAHKSMRNVVPKVLIKHGLRPAYVDLFDVKSEVNISFSRGIKCSAFANVHHDKNKMEDYRNRIGKENQQFFTDVDEAKSWLQTIN